MATYPKLAFTCPMKWDEMRGDERQRFCDKCNRHVVNLSVLTEEQRAALLASTRGERLCVAYYQRLSRPSNESPTSMRRARSRTLMRWGAAAAFLGTLVAFTSQTSPDRAAAERARLALANTYYSARYKVEQWIDDVRVYFGGTPKYSGMTLGVRCDPSTPIFLPAPPASPSNQPEPGESPPTGDPG